MLEDALSGIEGIETIEAQSENGASDISIEFEPTREIEAAANDVRDAVSRVVDRLPDEADVPDVSKGESDVDAVIWLNMSSTTKDALRLWLDRDQLATHGLAVGDVEAALKRQHVDRSASCPSRLQRRRRSPHSAPTLTPMMSSPLLRPHTKLKPNLIDRWLKARFAVLSSGCRRGLARSVGRGWLLGAPMVVAVVAVVAIVAIVAIDVLFGTIPSALAPAEDRGVFVISIDGPEGAGFDYPVEQMKQVEALLAPLIGPGKVIQRASPRVPGSCGRSEDMHTGRVRVVLQDWDERDVDTPDVAVDVLERLQTLTGVTAHARVTGGLVRVRGQPLQIVLGGPEYAQIAR